MTDSNALMEELLAWTKLSNRQLLIDVLKESTKNNPAQLIAYEASDGERTQVEVAKLSGLSQPRVSVLWASWRRSGIVMDAGGGRMRHLARPSDLGLLENSKPASD